MSAERRLPLSPIAQEFARILLQHHRDACLPLGVNSPELVSREQITDCVITYGQLCQPLSDESNLRCASVGAGRYLGEIDRVCTDELKLPPINALAVNKQQKSPGGRYPGGAKWEREVSECIVCKSYPSSIE